MGLLGTAPAKVSPDAQRRERLAREDAAAWGEYASACRAGRSAYQRQVYFSAAMETLNALARFDQEHGGDSR